MKGEDVGKGNGQMVGGRYHCIVVRSFDFILGATAALWEDIRFISERHLYFFCFFCFLSGGWGKKKLF